MFIKKGDTVKVISGDHKGITGVVKEVLVKEQRVIVEGVNKVSRHTRPSNEYPDGGIIQKEAPIAISNVMLFDTKEGKALKVGYKYTDEVKANGKQKKVRYFKKSGNVLDK